MNLRLLFGMFSFSVLVASSLFLFLRCGGDLPRGPRDQQNTTPPEESAHHHHNPATTAGHNDQQQQEGQCSGGRGGGVSYVHNS